MLAPLMLAASVVLQAPAEKPTTRTVHPFEIGARYDRVRDFTSTKLYLGPIIADPERDLMVVMSVFHTSTGEKRGPLADASKVHFHVTTSSKRWIFLDSHGVDILADALRLDPNATRNGHVDKDGSISETVSWDVPFDQFRRIAAADSVELAVGTYDVRLTGQQVAGLRDLAARLAVSSDDAEKIGADHVLLVRERRREMQAAMDKAIEKARAAVKAMPKARRVTEGNRRGVERMYEEFAVTDREYQPTDDETQELFKAYPEFADAPRRSPR